MHRRHKGKGFTIIELLIGLFILVLSSTALLSSFVSQVRLGDIAQNISLATHDADHVLESMRQKMNGGPCSLPDASISGGWDAWLQAQVAGKSLKVPNPSSNEKVFITCLNRDGSVPCASNQISTSEWQVGGGATNFNPIHITVAVCWRQEGRIIGECSWDGTKLIASDTDSNGVISSPVMLLTTRQNLKSAS
jgi:type II secretory pathway pseudopilin PulG